MNSPIGNFRNCGFGGLRTSPTLGVPFLLCAAALVLVPMASADTPSITITPSVMKTLESNASVKVSGSGFPLYKPVVIWFDTNGNGQLDDEEPAVVLASSLLGAFNDAPLALTDVPAGVHRIQAGVCPGTTPPPSAEPAAGLCLGTAGAASAQFELDFSVVPTKFGSGTTVTVTGYGSQIFPPNASVTVWFDANNNSILDAGETSVSANTNGDGGFTAPLLVKGAPGKYSVAAKPPASAAVTLPMEIDTCWFQECYIDNADTVCLLGHSPTDLGSVFADCKPIDSNYTTKGGYPIDPKTGKISNTGPTFMGAGVLAAALVSLDPPGIQFLSMANPACAAMQTAIGIARNIYGNDPLNADYDAGKPFNDLTDIACGDTGGPAVDLNWYRTWVGHDFPDQLLVFGAVNAVQLAAATAVASGNEPGSRGGNLGNSTAVAGASRRGGDGGLRGSQLALRRQRYHRHNSGGSLQC